MASFDELWDAAPGASSNSVSFDALWDAAPSPNASPFGDDNRSNALFGMSTGMLNSGTFGLSNKAIAGGTALIDALMGDASLGDAYEQRKAQLQGAQQAFHDVAGNAATGLELMSGVSTPVPIARSGSTGIRGFLENLGLLSATGGGLSALQSFNDKEGSWEEKAKAAGEAAKSGAIASALIGAPIEGAAQLASAYGPEIAAGLQRRSIGARVGDYTKNANDIGIVADTEGGLQTRTKAHLDDLLSRGELGASRNPETLLATADAKAKTLSAEINDIIQSKDSLGVQPKWENAMKFIEEGKVPADKIDGYLNRLAALDSNIAKEGGGLSYLQQQKVALGELWDPNDGTLNKFNRQLYKDLQTTIEGVAPEVAPLNEELSKFITAKKILQGNLARANAPTFADKLGKIGFTTGGYTGFGVLGSLLGGPVGTAIGLGAGGLAQYFRTPGGQAKLAEIMSQSPEAARALSEKVPQLSSELQKSLPSSERGQTKGIKSTSTATSRQLERQKESSPSRDPFSNQNLDSVIAQAQAQIMAKEEANKEASKPKDIEPLVDAVIKQESGGNAKATSKVGAKGLMQLMPETAKEVAYEMGLKEYDLEDPETNRAMGTFYLQKMLKKFHGNVELALAAYNAGPGRVMKWINRYGANWDDIAAGIRARDPKHESLKYVSNIMKNYAEV